MEVIFMIIAAVVGIAVLIFKMEGEKKAVVRKEELKESLNKKLASIEGLKITRSISGVDNIWIFSIDKENEKVAYIDKYKTKIVSYSDIIGVEIIQDDYVIYQKALSRTVGGVVVGGLLNGGVGAIVGGLSGESTKKTIVSKLILKVLLNDIESPKLNILCFDSKRMTPDRKKEADVTIGEAKKIYDLARSKAENIKDVIDIIINQNNNKR